MSQTKTDKALKAFQSALDAKLTQRSWDIWEFVRANKDSLNSDRSCRVIREGFDAATEEIRGQFTTAMTEKERHHKQALESRKQAATANAIADSLQAELKTANRRLQNARKQVESLKTELAASKEQYSKLAATMQEVLTPTTAKPTVNAATQSSDAPPDEFAGGGMDIFLTCEADGVIVQDHATEEIPPAVCRSREEVQAAIDVICQACNRKQEQLIMMCSSSMDYPEDFTSDPDIIRLCESIRG